MKVLLISGSVGIQSCTRVFLQYLEKLLQDSGVDTILWDLGENPLPIAVPEYHNRQSEHPSAAVRKFNKVVQEVDGFILGSPMYHGSYSGVLKNALDNLPPQGFMQKPVGLVSHSSNVRSCVVPCDNLRPVVRSLSGYSTQMQIGTSDSDYKKGAMGVTLTSTKIKKRAKDLIGEIIDLSKLLKDYQTVQ